MKKVILILIVVIAMLFSGCSLKSIAEDYIVKHELDKKVTTICLDIIDKKDCPRGFKEYNIDIVPKIPFSSRFCFGITDGNFTVEDGMRCYTRDIIK